jgi:hypothetical protein
VLQAETLKIGRGTLKANDASGDRSEEVDAEDHHSVNPGSKEARLAESR